MKLDEILPACASLGAGSGLPGRESQIDAASTKLRGKLTQRTGRPPAIETSDHKMVTVEGDEAALKVLNDKRLNGVELEATGHFTTPDRFRARSESRPHRARPQGRQAENGHILVRRLFHPFVRARPVLVLPGRDRARTARSG